MTWPGSNTKDLIHREFIYSKNKQNRNIWERFHLKNSPVQVSEKGFAVPDFMLRDEEEMRESLTETLDYLKANIWISE